MDNIELLPNICKSYSSRVVFEKGTLYIHLSMINRGKRNYTGPDEEDNGSLFTGCEISQIMGVVISAEKKYKGLKFPVKIVLPNIDFIDKLTYVFLECICFYLISIGQHFVTIQMTCEERIQTRGVFSSPLLLLATGKREKAPKYLEKFRFDIYGYHFRKIVNGVGKENTNYLGEFGQQIDFFLKPFGIDEKCRDLFSTVCCELVGNASEHAHSECLIDIDIAPGYSKVLPDGSTDDNYYYGINIAVLNFSSILLGDGVAQNVIQKKPAEDYERYGSVQEAFSNHKMYFNDEYTETDFYNITAFQDHISGRECIEETGGTGLPKLIKSLQEMSDTYRCYVISGDRCVNFYKEKLEYENGWIGFNESNEYIEKRPDEGICTDCLIYMPGTAYNLNFVMKGVKIDDEKN